VSDQHTTAVVEQYLIELAGLPGDAPAEPIVRSLLAASVNRLHVLCSAMLYRNYPRLAQPPMNLQSEEMLSSVIERMLKALRQVRPGTVRQFFALANQHMRWELNDLARKLDERTGAVELHESAIADSGGASSVSTLSPNTIRMLEAIERLPDEEKETFCLVRVQGMTQAHAAEVLGVSVKTVQRRLNRCLPLLVKMLEDLHPDASRPV
jgi:RNA polymerase sigma-70 factor (ECF subfamily)